MRLALGIQLSPSATKSSSPASVRAFLFEGAQMAFTQATLQAQLTADGAGCLITQFIAAGDSNTDVYVQNENASSSRKAGWTQIVNTRTATQAAGDIRTNLTS